MLIFLKLGGSLITDKTQEGVFLADRMKHLATAIGAARAACPDLRLLIGHGSGSFGHFAARRHGTASGVATPGQWAGFAEVARVARQLNGLVTDVFAEAGVPVWPVQPSASAGCDDGVLHHLEIRPLRVALDRGLVPLVYGDVALDTVRGGTIVSTESLFFFLAPVLHPQHILLLGEVSGVLDDTGQLIRQITPTIFPDVEAALGESHGVDVTGGMASKVRDMTRLAHDHPGLEIHILSGLDSEVVREALIHPESAPGTTIRAD